MKILCVCLGNICRSPIAEGVFLKLTREHQLSWTVESAGTNRYHKGGPADPRTVEAAQAYGIDLSKHIARRMRSQDFDNYDIVFSMADDVLEEMQEFIRSKDDEKKIVNFLDVLYPNERKSVPDPWYGDEKDFDECCLLIERACRQWVKKLKKEL